MTCAKWNDLEDIGLASCLLQEEKLNLVIVKGGQVLASSKGEGIYPLFKTILDKGDSLSGAALADKIVGAAIAMLCLYARIASVYADLASQKTVDLLKEQEIDIVSKVVVPHILNHDGTDLCPFEKLAQSVSSPSQLFSILESLFIEVSR